MITIIEYQEMDKKLKKVNDELKMCAERKIALNAQTFLKQVDERATKLDKRSFELITQYADISKVYEEKRKQIGELIGVANNLQEHKEIEYIVKKVEKLQVDAKRIEVDLSELSSEIDKALSEFDDLKKRIAVARKEYIENKEKYEKLKDEKAGEIKSLEDNLAKIETEVDKKLLKSYQQKKEEKIFPVFVKLISGSMCEGCGMELPLATVNKLNVEKMIECEECKRIIYVD